MLELVRFIKNGDIGKRLFGYTSVHKLVVSIYDPAEWNKEALHIEYNSHTKRFNFHYRPKPFEPIETERYYDEEVVVSKFLQYINWLKW